MYNVNLTAKTANNSFLSTLKSDMALNWLILPEYFVFFGTKTLSAIFQHPYHFKGLLGLVVVILDISCFSDQI